MPKTLKECLHVIGIESDDEKRIDLVTCDSRECHAHSIYIGEKYLEDALSRGAYVVDSQYARTLLNYFYDDPSHHYFIIGVTGTNAKTSITHFLKDVMSELGYRCIRLGTHQNEFEEMKEESLNTTMDVMSNLNIFLNYIDKIDCIIMEVSTHAIEENRISFISFDRIIYTNITPEHLDYHLTFTHYKYSKYKLRRYLKENGKILFNYDDQNLRELLLFERKKIISYGKKGHFQIENIETTLASTSFTIQNQDFLVQLSGEYVAMNCLAVLCCLFSMNIPLEICKRLMSKLQYVEGRMEIIHYKKRLVVIDYAHTPAALQAVCLFLRKHTEGKFVCVFGCGGERDRQKRPIMAQIASSLCDWVIVTEDNNRNELFIDIIKDMRLERFCNVQIVEKRENALSCAFHTSQERDIILIAGKGNEQFLIANGVKTPYNDKTCFMSI